MEENRAAMVFTDPPDDVPIDGHADGLGVIRHREFAMGSGEMEEGQFADFLTQACGLLAHYSLDGAAPLHLHGLAPHGGAARRRQTRL
jgi:hypothetical protein